MRLRAVAVAVVALVCVSAPLQRGGAPAAAAGTTSEAVVSDPVGVGSSAFVFSALVGGRPVRWNPCQAIHYRLNPAGAPTGGVAAVRSAVARVAQVTGTHWVYDGTSPSTPTSIQLPRALADLKPVLIGWTDAAHSDLLRGASSATFASTHKVWFGHTSGGRSVAAITGAVVALNRASRLPAQGIHSWRTTALHELGHVMGLAHAGSPDELMNASLSRRYTDYRQGDLRGLALLGRSQGCVAA